MTAILTGLGLLALAMPAYAQPHLCRKDDKPTRAAVPDAAEVAAHRHFQLPPIRYDGRVALKAPFDATVLVDEGGRVVCVVLPRNSFSDGQLTAERVTLLESTSGWIYAPFVSAGQPASVLVTERINEIIPTRPVPTPEGLVAETALTLRRGACFGRCPTYQVTVRGDGHVVYDGGNYADTPGRLEYTLTSEAAAALVTRMRGRDLWSMRSDYSAAIYDAERSQLSLRVGNSTKEIVDYDGEAVGMPQAVADMEKDIDETTGAPDLVHISARGLNILDGSGFAYASPQGAGLLVRAVLDDKVSDETIGGLLDRHAPLTGGDTSMARFSSVRFDQDDDATALNAALGTGREALVPRLIDAGALLKDGKLDQPRIDSAFRYAITGGRLRMVETLAAYHPALTFLDEPSGCCDRTKVSAPVSLLLERVIAPPGEPSDVFAIARLLIGLGCDINGVSADGNTLLILAADNDDAEFVRWLLDHGASVNPANRYGNTALSSTSSEEVALSLLEAGADPTKGENWIGNPLVNAKHENWTRVIAWLEAHGYGEQLKAAAPRKRGR